jgi:CRISPR system Cascade subunit CasA
MQSELFNLADEPWIPVLFHNGQNHMVSLREVFSGDESIADLALNPYERIAVMRLLICIAIAALDDEKHLENDETWLQCLPDLSGLALEYLNKWHDRFNLYGEHAFLQPDDLTTATEKAKAPRDKLFLHLSSGNNDTLYDHRALDNNREISDAQLAVGLLTYLNFSAGGQHSKCFWSGKETPMKKITAAPCREKSMLHTMILGEHLLKTIWLNLITKDMSNKLPQNKRGRPFWELENLSRSQVEGKGFEKTLLGRLVPLSRVIKLTRGERLCMLGECLKYDSLPLAREVMGTIMTPKKGAKKIEKPSYVSASTSKQPWRDLQAILNHSNCCGALTLQQLNSIHDQEYFMIWCGGLVADRAKDGAAVEWSAKLSTELLNHHTLETYQNGIEFADLFAWRLNQAAEIYAGACKGFDPKKKNFKERQSLTAAYTTPAARWYWNALSIQQPMLLDIAEKKDNWQMSDWREQVRTMAKEAYEYACPKITGRQTMAYVKGLDALNN